MSGRRVRPAAALAPAPPITRVRPRRHVLPQADLMLQWLVWALVATVVLPSALALLVNGRPDALGDQVADQVGLGVRLVGLLPAGAVLALAAAALLPGLPRVRITAVPAAHLALIGWALVSTAINGDLGRIGVTTWVIAVGSVSASILAVRARASAFRLIVVPFAVICLASLALLAVRPALALHDVSRTGFSPLAGRLAGVLDHSNQLGIISGILVILVVAERPRFAWLWAGLGAVTLLLTESRTAWFACAAGVAITLVVRWLGDRHEIRRVLISAFVLALALVTSVPFWLNLDRFMVPLSERPAVWDFVIPRIADAPLIGHGAAALPHLRDTEGLLLVRVGHAHNLAAQELFSAGIIGLLLMVGLLFGVVGIALRQAREGEYATLALVTYVILSAPFDLTVSALASGQAALLLALVCVLATMSPATTGDATPEDPIGPRP